MVLCSLIHTQKKSESEVVRVHLMQSKCSRWMVTLILNLDTRWKWVVQFTPRPLYSEDRTRWIEGWLGTIAGLDGFEKW